MLSVLRGMKVDLTHSSLHLPFSMLHILRGVQSIIQKEGYTNLDLLTVEVGHTDGLDESFLHEFLHGQPSRRRVGVVKPAQRQRQRTILSFSATYIVIDSLVIIVILILLSYCTSSCYTLPKVSCTLGVFEPKFQLNFAYSGGFLTS
jgi:hypothetical protein